MKPVELVLIMRDKTRQSLLEAGKNVDGLSDDYEELIKMIRASESAMERSGNAARKMSSDYGNLQSVLAKIGGTAALIGFGKEIIKVRSEFQNMEASFKVFLGDAEKATSFMKELQSYAFNNVFEFKDLAGQAAQLLAYGNDAKEVTSILDKLSNVAAGVNQPLERFVELYNKAKSRGKLDLIDVQQWSVMGDMIGYLSDMLGKSKDEIRDMISAGKIGFNEIDSLLNSLTESGGRFSGMMEEKMKTLGDSIGLLQDSLTAMFNELGEKTQDVLRGGILFVNMLVESYEKVGKILISLIATYGTYRTALAVDAIVNHIKATGGLINAIKQLEIAQKALNLTIIKNPYVLAATAIIGLVTAIWALKDGTDAQGESLKRLKSLQDDYNKSVESEKAQIDILFGRLKAAKEGTDNYQKAKDNIISKYGSYLDGLNEEIKTLKNVEAAYQAISGAAIQAAKDRVIERGTQEAIDAYTDKWGKNIGKIQEEFKKKFGEVQGTLLLDSLKDKLSSGGEFSNELKDAISSFTKIDVYSDFNTKQTYSRENNPIRFLVEDVQKQKVILDGEIKEIENIFGAISKPAAGDNDGSETVFSNLNDELKAAQKNADDLKKKLEDLRGGKTESTNYAKDIEDTAEALAKAEKKLASLTGKDKKTISSEESTFEKQLKAEKAYAEALLDIQTYINGKKVELIQEGIQQEKAEIEKGYKDELRSIDKLRDKAIQEYNEKNKLKGDKAVTAENYETKVPDLAAEINAASIAAGLNARKKLSELNKQAVEEVQKVINETDEIFKSHLEIQTEQIKKEYEERKKVIIKNVEDVEEQKRLLASLDEKEGREIDIAGIDNTLKSLDIKKEIELEKQKLVNKTYLFETDKAQALLKIEKDSAATRLQLLQELKEKGVQGLEDEIDLLIEKIAEMNAELEKMPTQKFQEALSGLKQVAGALSQLGGEAGQVFSALGSSIDSISSSLDFSDKLKEGGASISDYAGQISSAISGIVNIINTISEASSKRKQVEKEFYKNQIALAHEYALALNEQLRTQSEMSGSGFIKDYTGKLNDGFKALEDAVSGYEKALGKLAEGKAKVDLRNAIDWGSVGKGAASGAAVGAAIGSVIPVIGTAIGAVVGAIGGFFAGLFGGKKKKDVTAGLLDVFPELVDSAGNLNRELAKTLINTNQVDDATKQLIQNALDWADAVDAANEQIKEVVVELSGDLGNSLRDAIITAFKSGEDASKRMFDAASKSMENFVANMLYSTLFSKIFDDFGEMLRDALDINKEGGDVLDVFDWLISAMDDMDDRYVALLDAFKKRAAERGFEMWQNDEAASSSSQKGKAGAFTTMTQDQAGKLEGLFTSLQNHTANIDENVISISDAMYDAIDSLMRIAENTEFCRRLDDIADDIAKIIRDGLKVK